MYTEKYYVRDDRVRDINFCREIVQIIAEAVWQSEDDTNWWFLDERRFIEL